MIYEYLFNIKKIRKMAFIDLKKIYKGAALGWLWIIAKPAMNIFMYFFLFAIGLKIGANVNGYPYFIWLITGLVPWFYMSEIIITLPNAYFKYSYLVTKMKFPVSTIPTYMSLSRFMVNTLLMLIVLILYFSVTSNYMLDYVSLLFYMVLMFVFMTILGSIIALVSSMSKDLGHLIKLLQLPILFFSPIFWNIDKVDIEVIKYVELINPFAYFTNGIRDVFINNGHFWDKPLEMSMMLLILFILFLLNYILYKKIVKVLPDYL